jgi:hypothetical protein
MTVTMLLGNTIAAAERSVKSAMKQGSAQVVS